jgi:hypothetical protein
MTTYINPTYENIKETKGYAVLFGNLNSGWHLNNEQTLQQFWRKAVSYSSSHRVGDVVLFYNGVCIRSVWNFSSKILYNRVLKEQKENGYYDLPENKTRHRGYPVVYNKY